MQNTQHNVHQAFQLSPPNPPFEAAAEAAHMAEQLPQEWLDMSTGLPRQELARSPALSQAKDASPQQSVGTSGQPHVDNEGSSPMQVDPATEMQQMSHEQSQRMHEHVDPGQSMS